MLSNNKALDEVRMLCKQLDQLERDIKTIECIPDEFYDTGLCLLEYKTVHQKITKQLMNVLSTKR